MAAKKHFMTALQENPTDRPLRLTYAQFLEQKGERRSAQAMYRKQLARNPTDMEAMAGLARLAGAAHAVFNRTACRPCHTSKRTHNKQPLKNNTRRERITQGLTKDPVQHRPRRPLHIIQVERPAKEPRHQSEKQTPCIHRNTNNPPSKT